MLLGQQKKIFKFKVDPDYKREKEFIMKKNTVTEKINVQIKKSPVWKRAEKAVQSFAFDAEKIITTAHESIGLEDDQKIKKIFDLIPGEVMFRGSGITICVYTYAMIVTVKLDGEDVYREIDLLGNINPDEYPGSPYEEKITPALIADLFGVYAAELADAETVEYMREHTCMCYRCKVHHVGLNICPQNCYRLGI